ncbi:MAG: hypothetical protein JRJ84_15035, partial [Deltaproteobacteria bacterium]|nr:hypothetical protein [Deltaproteobacteria bacterium]
MPDRPVLVALAGGLLALSLACGGSFGPTVEPHWTQADIRSAALAQGWTVDDCSRDRYDRTVEVSCYLERGNTFATVFVTTAGDTGLAHPGPDRDVLVEADTLLEIVVADGDASAALLGTLVLVGTPIEEVSKDILVSKLTQAGWTVTSSSEETHGNERYTFVEATQG